MILETGGRPIKEAIVPLIECLLSLSSASGGTTVFSIKAQAHACPFPLSPLVAVLQDENRNIHTEISLIR